MSKMGQAFFEMQEDALSLDRESFVKKYGKINEEFYDQIWNDNEPDPEYLVEQYVDSDSNDYNYRRSCSFL